MKTQQEVLKIMQQYLADKQNTRRHYKKYKEVDFRYGVIGETINTIIEGELETTFTIPDDDNSYIVIRNKSTECKEEYVINIKKFLLRYDKISEPTGEVYGVAQAKGEIVGVEVDHSLLCDLGAYYGQRYNRYQANFIASWGEELLLLCGDIMALPYPSLDEVYRIEKGAFESTYKPVYKGLGDVMWGLMDIHNEIILEIEKRPHSPNLGKKGCLRRIDSLLNEIRQEYLK